ncbi:MAG: FAD:protein FMN transferase [Flavobacteriales bacterium]
MRSSFLLSLFAFAMVACNSPEPESTQSNTLFPVTTIGGEAQGTTYNIKYLNDSSNYAPQIDSILYQFDQDLSGWTKGSLINRLNAFNRTDTVFAFIDSTKNFSVVFDVSREIYIKTQGAFDPTVFPLVELWGFGQKEAGEVNEESIAKAKELVGMEPSNIDMIEMYKNEYFYEETQIRKGQLGVKLDFNAIAQGYSVDLIGDFLESKGVNDYMIELGGELLCKGVNGAGEAWKIAIDKPVALDDERALQALLTVSNKAVATSGSYRKFKEVNGKRYSHTIDPKTGYPVEHQLLSVTVLASSCAAADAYATAFMVMGAEATMEFLEGPYGNGMEVYLISAEEDGYEIEATPGLKEYLSEL